ncbi:hypothetical protein V491_03189 [Pseudogymnoascus sp. VKM F-3775]|nr:hypothetical protein V491_03189 [Pseudogymnoascus sp. VKM F-3775]
MVVFSLDRFIQDRDTPHAIWHPRLPLATSRPDISYATIPSSATSGSHAHARESCKSPPTSPSSATRSTALSRTDSSFSTDSNSSAASDATSVSTAPSTGSNNPQINLDQHLLSMSVAGSNLPCIFRELLHCEHNNFVDSDSWSEHIIEHFGSSGPPPHALCIFCDTSFKNDNATVCWNECLDHISEHLESGAVYDTIRPDFLGLKYMRDNGIITEDDYALLCLCGSERPKVSGLIPLDCEPEEMIAKKRAEQYASNRIIVHEPRRRQDRQHSTRGKKAPTTVIHSPR